MRIVIGSDHAGLDLKNEAAGWLAQWGHDVQDIGAHTFDAQDDYPDFARSTAEVLVSGGAERGLLLCGSGVGASIAANKIPGVRAAMCHDTYSAHQGVEHDDMNMMCIGGRIVGPELAKELIQAFLGATFSGEERHVRRLGKVRAIEAHYQRKAPGPDTADGGTN